MQPKELRTQYSVFVSALINQFRYIKILPDTIGLGMWLWRLIPANSIVIPQSLAPRSIVLG